MATVSATPTGSGTLDDLLAASADPVLTTAALRRLDVRAVEESGALPAVVAVTGVARWAADTLATEPAALEALAHLDVPVAVRAATDATQLRSVYRQELLRIAARDLLGLDDLPATTAALSSAAAAAIEAGLAQHGLAQAAVAVVGMGKLGGEELNFSSDVDLLLAADDPAAAEGSLRRMIETLRACVRVDLALRPEGRDGDLVRTVESYASYWERWAAPWERQALLRARVVAGEPGLARAWEAAAAAIVWNRPFAADDIRSVRALKERAEAEVARRSSSARDVKRGLGGIRDIEFAVQLLALVHGGDDPTLRVRGTLDALAELSDGGYVATDDATALADAYVALRRVEHRLQLVDLQPAHVLPADPVAMDRLARSLGHLAEGTMSAGEVLAEHLRQHRAVAREVHERLWFRPLLGEFAGRERALAAFGFAEVARTEEGIAELTRGLGRSSRLMRQLLPLVLDWLSRTPDPDVGLLGLRRLADGPARARALVEPFRDSPEVARRVCVVLGTSRLLGETLVHHPDLVPMLGDDRDGLRAPTAEELATGVQEAVGWRPVEERRPALKRFTDREGFRIGAADVLGALSTREVGAALTGLAEAAVQAAVDTVVDTVIGAQGGDGGGLAVVALGRFGGAEMSYPSDLDVVFTCRPGGQEEAERSALALLRFLGDGPDRVYDVDADLRPEGRDGPLVRSVDSWAAYVERWAEPWERLAWVKARTVAGDRALGDELVEGVLAPWVWDRPVSDAERVAIRRVKVRVEQERVRPGDDRDFHLKLGRGGLADIEFCTQLLQLDHGVRATASAEALAGLFKAGAIDDDEYRALADAHGFLEAIRNRLFLVTGEPGDALPARSESLARLASSLGTTATALRDRHRKVTRRARRVVERRFYGAGG
jgi:glutamate-ammonia-ligase adenylyltransferase